uniref:LRRG00125 n=1 Tax=Rattus norvegicus TaxID=10116 RepID=Q6QI83_RAT|nr:LRRG00125 [Rattus norvegicus]|eukprot:NP_001041400.1 uncharacterized protein LOC498836 [Rattus norvegicus]
MASNRLPDDQPIFDQLPDLLTGVGIGDFVGLIGVQPDLRFTTARTLEANLFCTQGCGCSSERKERHVTSVSSVNAMGSPSAVPGSTARLQCPYHTARCSSFSFTTCSYGKFSTSLQCECKWSA